jgi:hypothetical protein
MAAGPAPDAPVAIISHDTLLTAVHGQPLVVVTVIGPPFPPVAPIDCDSGLIPYVHATG